MPLSVFQVPRGGGTPHQAKPHGEAPGGGTAVAGRDRQKQDRRLRIG